MVPRGFDTDRSLTECHPTRQPTTNRPIPAYRGARDERPRFAFARLGPRTRDRTQINVFKALLFANQYTMETYRGLIGSSAIVSDETRSAVRRMATTVYRNDSIIPGVRWYVPAIPADYYYQYNYLEWSGGEKKSWRKRVESQEKNMR